MSGYIDITDYRKEMKSRKNQGNQRNHKTNESSYDAITGIPLQILVAPILNCIKSISTNSFPFLK